MDEGDFLFETIEGMDEGGSSFETIEGMDEADFLFEIIEDVETKARHSEARGRVILVKLGECTKRIGIDGSPEAIKHAIKSAFGLRIRSPFWLEDEHGVVRSVDRDMPLGTYKLHRDEGLRTKICQSTHPNHVPCRAEEKSFYSQADFSAFLVSRGWIGLKGLRGNWTVDSSDNLKSDEVYHGVGMVNVNAS